MKYIKHVFDDFLTDDEYQSIYDKVTSASFTWVRANILLSRDDPKTFGNPHIGRVNEPCFYGDQKYNIQFVHNVHYSSLGFSDTKLILGTLAPLFQKLHINRKNLLRCKINLNPYQGETHNFSGWHTDNDGGGRTAIYYLNTNNGFTTYQDGDKCSIVKSKANRLFTFPTQTRHSGVSQTDSQFRALINMNWTEPVDITRVNLL
jgi:hypothetical protein